MSEAPEQRPLMANDVCSKCGICCNGTLFSYVSVYPEEEEFAKSLGFELIDKGRSKLCIRLGCVKYVDDACTTYLKRPRKCHTYYCVLQRQIMNGTVSHEEGLEIVARMKELSEKIRVGIGEHHETKVENYRELMHDYLKAVEKKFKKGQLTEFEKDELIPMVFEQMSLMDRHFRETSLLIKYGKVLQKLDYEKKLNA